jgi:hypothetical protein
MNHLTRVTIILTLIPLSVSGIPADPSPNLAFTVHEWGTFTSIAGRDGTAVEWIAQGGPQDLPCYVNRLRFNVKGFMPGTVRMETPVLYFYAPHELTVSVSVRFRQGVVSEWYPDAEVLPSTVTLDDLRNPALESSVSWPDVRVTPGSQPAFRMEDGTSHYYAARDTDASPLESGTEREKFLFYRGVGGFEPPLTAVVEWDGSVTVESRAGEAIGDVILFENHDGAIAYNTVKVNAARVTLDPVIVKRKSAGPLKELERTLISHGLYRKEASAMVRTWRDAWFEEGTRLFYIARRRVIDDILPLDITPAPAAIERVFVGRIELVGPETEAGFRAAVAAGDRTFFEKYSRFAPAMVTEIFSSPAEQAGALSLLRPLYGSWIRPPARCE